jgi:hypothetical protein
MRRECEVTGVRMSGVIVDCTIRNVKDDASISTDDEVASVSVDIVLAMESPLLEMLAVGGEWDREGLSSGTSSWTDVCITVNLS